MDDEEAQAAKVAAMADQIAPILQGAGPADIGVLLMWMTARWLAGHVVPGGNRGATRRLQRNLFEMHQRQMWKMVEASAEEFAERLASGDGEWVGPQRH
jgi:hypothetical protein